MKPPPRHFRSYPKSYKQPAYSDATLGPDLYGRRLFVSAPVALLQPPSLSFAILTKQARSCTDSFGELEVLDTKCVQPQLSTSKTHAPYFHLWPLRFYRIFPINSQTVRLLEKKVIENKMCALIFSATFLPEAFLILRVIKRYTIINVHRVSCIVPLILSHFDETILLDTFSKNTEDINHH